MADGALSELSGRGLRPLDPARVAAVRETLDATADFSEDARRTVADLVPRFSDLIRDGDLAPCRDALADARARLETLSPAALEPRGWFDSRGKRLKAFRRAFDEVRTVLTATAADLSRRREEAARRDGGLTTLWNQTRDAVVTLDVHVAAAVAWLGDQGSDDPRLSAFRRRVQELDALLLSAVRRLPLALAAQNADLGARDRLDRCADALSTWRADWSRALGVDGRKPKKVTPSQSALADARQALADVIAAADRELASACARRAEIVGRLDRLG